MAMYSFNHDSFGKTTNRTGAAGDNVKYNADLSKTQMDQFLAANANYLEEHGFQRPQWQIDAHLSQLRGGRSAGENAAYNARREAVYAVRSHIIPPEPDKAADWFDAEEKNDRKNARMSDRFIGALPRELTPDQCIEAVEAFCRKVTQDRIPWHFALHLELEHQNEPDWNPHTHIVFRDREIETGRRFLYTTAGPRQRAELAEKGIHAWSTKDFRIAWEEHMNHALERAGHDVRIDHRTLKEQGIDRKPEIHLGPKVKQMTEKGKPFESHDQQQGKRLMLYTLLDKGSRAEHNARIREENARLREQHAGREATGHCPSDPRTAEAFAAMVAGQRSRTPDDHKMQRLRDQQAEERRAMYEEQKRDRDALRAAQDMQRQLHKAWGKQHYASARQKAFEQTKEQTAEKWKQVRTIKNRKQNREAADALKLE